MALDLGVLCEEFLKEREKLLRGLAHPVIFSSAFSGTKAAGDGQGADASQPGSRSTGNSNNRVGSLAPWDVIPAMGAALMSGGGAGGTSNGSSGGESRAAFKNFMMEFGAVPVSARNMLKLLQNGESVLLFPGGVREAYKKKNEEYQLFWPEKSEFVRMAAKFNCTIIPFAAIGVDDGLDILVDADELKRTPFLGQMVTQNAASLPQARKGIAADGYEDESFIAPIVAPRLPPSRLYFMFMKPIKTSKTDLEDRQRSEEVYRQVKASVQDGLRYLKTRRQKDPYKDFGTRVMYETLRPGQQAPTFDL